MPSQGDTIRRIEQLLRDSGWHVVFSCIPNTPHVGVVPIPTPEGGACQRYPDILAYKGHTLRLIEVEPILNEQIANAISTRFIEQQRSLANPSIWKLWRTRIRELTQHELPDPHTLHCELVICSSIRKANQKIEDLLSRAGIDIIQFDGYQP